VKRKLYFHNNNVTQLRSRIMTSTTHRIRAAPRNTVASSRNKNVYIIL